MILPDPGRAPQSRRQGAKGTAMLRRLHHAAIICSNYEVSKRFYTECLGLSIVAEQ